MSDSTITTAADRFQFLTDNGLAVDAAIHHLRNEGMANLVIVGAIATVEHIPLQEALELFQSAAPFDPTPRELEMMRLSEIQATVELQAIEDVRSQVSNIAMFDRIHAELDLIPWDRVVHFFGRATDFANCILNLASKDRNTVEKAVLELSCVEHQHSVIQATPLATFFIVEMLPLTHASNRDLIYKLLGEIKGALDNDYLPASGLSNYTMDFVVRPECLWPPFESEDEEECLWESFQISKETFEAWHQVTHAIIAKLDLSANGASE